MIPTYVLVQPTSFRTYMCGASTTKIIIDVHYNIKGVH